MAGVKGRSGGARPNTGGARPGAGRKPKPPEPTVRIELPEAGDAPPDVTARDMLDLLQKIALGHIEASTVQVRAAIAAVQYTHAKKGEGGKKEEKVQKAKEAGGGKFAPASGPRLAAVGGRTVSGA